MNADNDAAIIAYGYDSVTGEFYPILVDDDGIVQVA